MPTASMQAARGSFGRSEEHTSELQSHSDLVCRLLLEKKKHQRTDLRSPTRQAPAPSPAPTPWRSTAPPPSNSSARTLLFFFNDTATTEIYTLSLHDALPI